MFSRVINLKVLCTSYIYDDQLCVDTAKRLCLKIGGKVDDELIITNREQHYVRKQWIIPSGIPFITDRLWTFELRITLYLEVYVLYFVQSILGFVAKQVMRTKFVETFL